MLSRHVRVQRVPGFGNGSAEHTAVSGTNGVLVLQVSAQGVGGAIDLATLRAWSGICGADANLKGSS